jgi:equilibrative nucleoside transporter 1/2/3
VLSVPKKKAQGGDTTHESPESAFIYFLTALGVSTFALFSFLYLLRRDAHRHQAKSTVDAMDSEDSPLHAERKTVGLWALFKKLPYLSLAVFIVFSITMVYPVFTQEILSNTPTDTAPRILKPASFIPLGFLLWDLGDLLGRMAPLVPVLSGGVRHPKLIFIASALRIVFVPLYLLCNIRGRGAVVPSDAFYLIVVQLLFGLTNGYLGSSCMMGAPEWVEPEEREAAGSFMGLMLVSGLTAGGLLSFAVARL